MISFQSSEAAFSKGNNNMVSVESQEALTVRLIDFLQFERPIGQSKHC